MDYTTLQTTIADFLNRSDLTTVIPTFITLTEAELQRTLRVREMLRNAQAVASSEAITLPSDFLEIRHALLADENQPLYAASLAELDDIRRNTMVTGQPTHLTVYKDKLELAPIPDKNYLVEIVYYQKIPNLDSSTNSTNWLSADHPDVYLYGSLVKAAPYLGEDTRVDLWRSEYNAAIEQLNANSLRTHNKGMRQTLSYKAF